MRTATAFIFALLMASPALADTPTPEPTATPTPTPEPTPTPTATPYMSMPETVTTTSVLQTAPTMIMPASVGRERVTIEVVAGAGVVCSQTDSEIRADAFRVFESPTPPYQVVDPHSPVYCKSKDGAVLQIVEDKNPDAAYTKVVKNLGSSLRVLRRNPRRSRTSIIVNNWNGAVYCGYTCPVNDTNGMLMNTIAQNVFRDKGDICCTSVGGNSDVSITAEFSPVR